MRKTFLAAILVLGISAGAFSQTIIRQEKKSAIGIEMSEGGTVSLKPTPTPAANQNNANWYTRPDSEKRFNRYVKGTVGPFALAKLALRAGYGTWRNQPEEWGDRWEGFGRRVASGFGENVISNTTTYALDEALKLDSNYYYSHKKDFKSKLTNAILSPVTARNKNGKRVFGVPNIAGIYAAHVISKEVWFPGRFDYTDGLRSGTISLGINAAFNIFKEFVLKK